MQDQHCHQISTEDGYACEIMKFIITNGVTPRQCVASYITNKNQKAYVNHVAERAI